jgi:glyoxylase-like metal-dependent hydrolase (beta-lactamase superfamily II)
MRRSVIAVAVSCLALIAAPASAQRDWSNVEIRVEQVAPGVAVLFGAGGNIGLSHGEDGNVLIDDQFAPLSDRIIAAVASVDSDPIRFVVNTHWHGDHTGGNENIGRTGAVIVAHDNVRRRMSIEQVVRGETVPASPAGALPVVTFGEDLTFHLNGDDIRVVHVGHAHTDGDALVYWTRANVIHMGDTFFNGMLPFIDLESGGSIDGLIAALGRAVDMTNETTRIIPGHGAVASHAELAAYRDLLTGLRAQIADAIGQGRTLDEIKAMRLADRDGRDTDFITPDAFVETVHRSLTATPAQHQH